MHLMIPYASALSQACEQTLQTLALPRLSALLGLLQPEATLGEDEYAPQLPHELALAEAWGWREPQFGFAAAQAQDEGIATEGRAWALLTPLHLSVSSDQVTALHPRALALDAAESRALFDALAELFPASEGWASAFGGPTRWYIAHTELASLRSASLERVINRNVDPWMPEPRLLRRLQNEMQMLLHRLALNAEREARGALPVNSVWISGCGAAQPRAATPALQLDSRLREALLDEDWAAWGEAWRALDAGPLQTLLDAARAGSPVTLTLSGERHARRWRSQPRSALARLWQGLAPSRPEVGPLLAAL